MSLAAQTDAGGASIAQENSAPSAVQLDIPRLGVQSGAKARRLALSATIFTALTLLVLAFGSTIQGIDYHALVHSLSHFPAAAIGWSILATVVSFAAVIGRDICAVYYVDARTPRLAPVVAGFCGTPLGNRSPRWRPTSEMPGETRPVRFRQATSRRCAIQCGP
ncbi:hypothetical protein [Mesorhizobium sp. B1-1-9]|uniref:hypothetical protein n=1 Tax=Mesorhizobium sp. B1-1-9 TaxID=2589975 RepID=UPI001AEDE8FC|nr:hypothetical protein [Mesorhizobium sp. B1-1-9]